MKKIVSVFLSIIMVVMLTVVPQTSVYAAGITVALNKSSVNIGETVTATFTIPDGGATVIVKYDGSILSCDGDTSGSKKINIVDFDSPSGAKSSSVSFTAIAAGSTRITGECISGSDGLENPVDYGSTGANVTVANAVSGGNSSGGNGSGGDLNSSNPDSNNGDNSLSALTISAGSLSPAFSYNTTNYTATVDYSVTKLAVSATPGNASATIASVTGNEDLQVGENIVSIVVKAGNGVTATYTIKVTRRAENDPENQNTPAESETPEPPTAENTGVGDGKFQIEGQTYVPAETIPEEVIPTDFSPSTIAFGQAAYGCLNFLKGSLTLLYLIPEGSEDGTGDLYVYDAKSNSIYQFVKLATENHYVIVLLPDAEDIPEGYSESFLAIEGKGQIAVYQPSENTKDQNTDTKQPDTQNSETETDKSLGFVDAIGECVASVFGLETVRAAEPSASDFYLMYCMNDEGETGWYQYDSVEGTYQRYSAQNMTDKSLTEKYDEAMDNIKKLTQKNWILILGMIIGTVIFAIIIIVLVVKKKGRQDDFDDDMDDDYKNFSDEEWLEAQGEDEDTENLNDEIETVAEELSEEATEDSEDEIEVEFYEMENAGTDKEDAMREAASDGENADDQFETIVIPSREHGDEQFGEAAEEIQAKYGKEDVRVTKRSMMDKFLDKMSLDNGEDIDDEFDEEFESKADLSGDGKADGEELLAASVAKTKEKQQERHTERMEKLQDELEQATERLKEMQKQDEKVSNKKTHDVKVQDLNDEDDDLEFLDLN